MIPYIFSADDDKSAALIPHRQIMQRYGFRVRQTSKLNSIGKYLHNGRVDCIHMDILFDSFATEPDWNKPNGLSMIKNYVKKCPYVPIMIISGYIDDKAIKKADEYGLTSSIYQWYNKPVDYDTIALDTMKAINESKQKKAKMELSQYMSWASDDKKKSAQKALEYIPLLPGGIDLKPDFLIDKLEKLSYKIIGNSKLSDIHQFQQIVGKHAYDFLKKISINHSVLAERFVMAVDEMEDKYLQNEKSFNLILNILEKFRAKQLCEEDLRQISFQMEETLHVSFGLKIGSKEDVARYLVQLSGD